MTIEKEKKVEELSNAEVAEQTNLKYEESLKEANKLADTNYKFYQLEKQKRIDLEKDNKRLREKLEEKTLQDLRSKDLERKSQAEQNNLLNTLFN